MQNENTNKKSSESMEAMGWGGCGLFPWGGPCGPSRRGCCSGRGSGWGPGWGPGWGSRRGPGWGPNWGPGRGPGRGYWR